MRIIHCADLHLDSAMNMLGREKAAKRRRELIKAFTNMVDKACELNVEVILIAGDMFDTGRVAALTREAIISCIRQHDNIRFFYLSGNHDKDNFTDSYDDLPENLYTFSSDWEKHVLCKTSRGDICLYSLEPGSDNYDYAALKLNPNYEDFNIVMLHGQIMEGQSKEGNENINLKSFRGRNIDYLALGHIHTFMKESLDVRGDYCYSGCLEGRGFDEAGPKGFVLVDIDEESYEKNIVFIPNSIRTINVIDIDVTEVSGTYEAIGRLENVLRGTDISEDDYVKINLTGNLDANISLDLPLIEAHFSMDYFCFKVKDETDIKLETLDFSLDTSLRGEFVRQVLEDKTLSDEDRKKIVRLGLKAFAGERLV